MKEICIEMTGVREYIEEMSVELHLSGSGRSTIVAFNEGGFNSISIDLQDLINWLQLNKPELLKPEVQSMESKKYLT